MSKKMNDPFVWYAVKDWVEDNMSKNLGLYIEQGHSFNTAFCHKTSGERTVSITTLLAPFFEWGIPMMLREAGVNVEERNTSGGDIIVDDQPWEIKTTQADAPTGSTHSASKPPFYIIIKYKMDRDRVLTEGSNEGIINEFGVWISESIDKSWWCGNPENDSSWTTLKVPVANSNQIDTVIGNLTHGTKYCKLINEDVQWK